MKKYGRILILLVSVLGLIGLSVYLSLRRTGFATPVECIEAFGDASKRGDAQVYLSCLSDALRSEILSRYGDAAALSTSLREEMKDLKGWGLPTAPEIAKKNARVDVDEIRPSGVERRRYRLERTNAGWRITHIGPPQKVQPPEPFGTHIGVDKP